MPSRIPWYPNRQLRAAQPRESPVTARKMLAKVFFSYPELKPAAIRRHSSDVASLRTSPGPSVGDLLSSLF